MMKYEFEQLAGYEVTDETYSKVIEPMYMSVDCDKLEFVKMLDKKYFALPTRAECLEQLKAKAREIYDICGHDVTHKQEDELHDMALEFCRRFHNAIPFLHYAKKLGCSYVTSIEIYSEVHMVTVDTITLI